MVAWSEQGRFAAVRLEPHPALAPVLLVPEQESTTHTTRGLLPDRVPHADAAFAAGRAALAVHAFTREPALLLAATEDRLHQSYRESAWPRTLRVVNDLRALGVPAAVSGAGPTVLALPGAAGLPAEVDLTGFTAHHLAVDRAGVRVEPIGGEPDSGGPDSGGPDSGGPVRVS